MTEQERRFEMTLEIDAPTDAVWKALVDAEELVRWFPLEAAVEPRVGGRYFISWQNEWQSDGRIEILEPERRLRTTWPAGPQELAVDYHLEGSGGRTRLRLVHSGFGRGAEWDQEYDGISLGWAFELRSLRHYLERHRGSGRRVAYVLGPAGASDAEVWERLLREGLGATPPAGLSEGDAYTLPVGGGETFSGQVIDCHPPRQFAGTVASLGDALFRAEVFAARPALWLAVWGEHADAVDAVRERWQQTVDRLFPQPAAKAGA